MQLFFKATMMAAVLLLGTVQAVGDEIKLSDVNTDLKSDAACTTYTDCFNCTISNCNWDLAGSACAGDAFATRGVLTQEKLYGKRNACGDPLNLCYYKNMTGNVKMEFNTSVPTATIPAGYFCAWDYANVEKKE